VYNKIKNDKIKEVTKMKWYATNGTEVKSFSTCSELNDFCSTHPDWWEVMA
jgi:hypothetical protein